MKWLDFIYHYKRFKDRATKCNQLIELLREKDIISFKQRNALLYQNKAYLTRFKHAAAVYKKNDITYEFYYKTSLEKHRGQQNIKIDEDIYIGNEPEKVLFKDSNEFFANFVKLKDCDLKMQKSIFKDEDTQEAFLRRVKEPDVNRQTTDTTVLFYLEDKIFEEAYKNELAKMENPDEAKLQELEDYLNYIFINYKILYQEFQGVEQ
jgi:hypothetical protein